MKNVLGIKGSMALALIMVILTSGAIFAGHRIFDVDILGNIRFTVSAQHPLQILSGDGQTPIGSGDSLSFGTVQLDYWGTGRVPPQKVFIRNNSDTWERIIVTGDMGDGIVPLFGLTDTTLLPAPDNAFLLALKGATGDDVMGWLGLGLLAPSSGSKQITITFSATDIAIPSLSTRIDFEDPAIGRRCSFNAASPLRDRYLKSHGVVFMGDTDVNGLAVLHECSNLEIQSHSPGEYFLAGNSSATMVDSGVPWLPEVITFSHPVYEVWLYACKCGSLFGNYVLSLHGYDEPNATGILIGSDSRATTSDWQQWKLTASLDRPIRSIKLTATGEGHILVVDDLEWKWAGE